MIITCKECNTSFNLDENFLKEGGSKVKCSICKDIFLAYPSASARMPDTYENFSSDAETDKKHSADDESNENLQSYYHEEEFNESDTGTAVSDTGIESDLQHEDFSMTIESSMADVEAASERFEEEEPGIATKQSEELSLDLDLNMEEPDEPALNLDLDSDETTPVETATEQDELSLDLELALDQENREEPDESPEDIELTLDSDIEDTLPGEPALNLDLDPDETTPVETMAEQDELSLDLDFALDEENREEPDKSPEDIELALDSDIEDALPDEPALNLDLDPDETTPVETEEVSGNIEFELEIEPD
ncbi:MAG: zinc-ribbon domain-containing protein, partial [Desulfosarcina sp.]|nr:zinc-ribbon domain-containing protein [Desulfobacterales bacterium]